MIGFGFVFSLITSLIVWVDYQFAGTAQTSEEFNTAGVFRFCVPVSTPKPSFPDTQPPSAAATVACI